MIQGWIEIVVVRRETEVFKSDILVLWGLKSILFHLVLLRDLDDGCVACIAPREQTKNTM